MSLEVDLPIFTPFPLKKSRAQFALLPSLTPEEFENGVFTLKTDQMLSVHTTPVWTVGLCVKIKLRFKVSPA